MAIDERLAVMRMVVAAVHVADSSVCERVPWDELAELEQEPHPLVAKIAFGIVRILDEQRVTTLITRQARTLWGTQTMTKSPMIPRMIPKIIRPPAEAKSDAMAAMPPIKIDATKEESASLSEAKAHSRIATKVSLPTAGSACAGTGESEETRCRDR